MKKIIAILLCLMLLPLNFTIVASAAEVEAELVRVFTDTFTGTPGNNASGWEYPETSGTSTHTYAAAPDDSSNSTLKLSRNASGGRTKMRLDMGRLGNGKYFDKDMVITFRAYDVDGNAELQLIFRQYYLESSGDIEGHQILGSAFHTPSMGSNTGRWLDVRIEVNMDGTTSTIVKDGDNVISNTNRTFDFHYQNHCANDGYHYASADGLWQLDFEMHSGLPGTWYIDDFFIWAYEDTELADKTGLEEILSDDFTGVAGGDPAGWTAEKTEKSKFIYAQDPKNSDESVVKVIREATGSSERVKMYRRLGETDADYIDGNMLITFRAYDEDGTGRLNLYPRAETTGTEGPQILTVELEKAITPDIATGVWYNCFVEIINNGVDDPTYSVWLIGDGAKVSVVKNRKITNEFNGISRIDFEANYTRLGDWYIDDIHVYRDHRDELRAAAAELSFDDIANGNLQDQVLNDLSLVDEVTYEGEAYPVRWVSSDENFISTTGAVNRRSFTHDVTLTAQIGKPGKTDVYVEKSFDVTVYRAESATDADIIQDYTDFYLKEELFTDEETDSITKDILPLPTEGPEGMIIEWVSDSDALSPDGTVVRPEFDANDEVVTLTATLLMGGESGTATLTYTVLKKPDPYIDINATLEMLTYQYLTSEDSGAITQNITLPTVGVGTARITWESQHDAITNGGVVTRGDSEVTGKLIATVTNPPASDTEEFTFTVLPTVEKILEIDMGGLNLDGSPEISESFDLPLRGATYGTQFTWESDSQYLVINGDRATVYRPPFSVGHVDANITLTATYGGVDYFYNYPVKILREGTDEEIVNSVMSELDFSRISDETEERVTDSLALVTRLNGVDISWSVAEEDEAFIDVLTGEVFRPLPGEGEESVTLAATFSRGYADDTKEYTFILPPFESDSEVLQKIKDSLIFSVLSNEDIDSVTNDLSLPRAWKYGSQVTWTTTSEYIDIVGETGVVTRPEWGTTIALAELKATISFNGLTDEKSFSIELLEKDYMEVVQDVWSEDFESWTQENMYKTTGAYWVTPGENEAELSLAEDPTDSENKVLKVDRTVKKSDVGYVYACSEAERGGIVYMGVRFFLETGGHFQANGRSTTCDQAPVSISGSGIVAGKYTISNYKANENAWNEVELVVDVPKERYHIYLNGELCTANGTITDSSGQIIDTTYGIPFHYYGQGREAYMHSFRMHFSTGKAFLIDDLYIKNKILYTDAQLSLAEAWENEFLAKNDINRITSTLVFPTVWADGVRVFYYSENSSILDTAGMIQLPSGEADVIFKVGFSDGFSEYIKSYKLHVVKTDTAQLSDEEAAAADLAAAVNTIKASGMLNSLKTNITMPASLGANGSTISITGFNSALDSQGKITQGTSAQNVTLTVKATKNGYTTDEVEISITVAAKSTPVTEGTGGTTGGTGSGSGGGGTGVKVNYGEQTKGDTGIDIVQPDEEIDNKVSFNDLSNSHWAHSELMYMVDNKIMNGTGSGNIEPERKILREEFIKMLVVAMDLKLSDKVSEFSDVANDAWYSSYIAAAKENGLINGYDDGRVGIGEEISRQDMAVMIFRAAELAQSGADDIFTDDKSISTYAKNAVYTLKDLGIINGMGDGSFAPKAAASRAETACMLYKAIKKNLFN